MSNFIEKGNLSETSEANRYRLQVSNSAELLKKSLEETQKGCDKVYALARNIRKDGNLWYIEVDSTYPTVAFDDNWKKELDIPNSPTVNEIRGGDGSKGWLFSSGVWFSVEDNQGEKTYLFLKRDDEAKSDPGCVTGAAGRCDGPIKEVTLNELGEEILFMQVLFRGKRRVPVFYTKEENKEKAIQKKWRQVQVLKEKLKEKCPQIYDENNQYQVKYDYLTRNIEAESDFYPVKFDENDLGENDPHEIVLTIDGKEVERIRGTAYLDEKNKTLEVRQSINYKLPTETSLEIVMDGEPYLRMPVPVKENELDQLPEKYKCVFALLKFIEMREK